MLYVEHAPLSSLCDVGLPPQHSALVFQAACADYFADTTMSKGPSFQLYVPLIFEFLWKLLCFSIYSSLVVLKLAKIWGHKLIAVQQPCTTKHRKDHQGSPSWCQRWGANPRDHFRLPGCCSWWEHLHIPHTTLRAEINAKPLWSHLPRM